MTTSEEMNAMDRLRAYLLAFAALVLMLASPAVAQVWTVGPQGADWSNPTKHGDLDRPTGSLPADAYEPDVIALPDGTDEDDFMGTTSDQSGSGNFRTDDHPGGIKPEKKIRINCEPSGPPRAKDNILNPGVTRSPHIHQGYGSVTWDENTDYASLRADPVSRCSGSAGNATNYMEPAMMATLPNGAKVVVQAQDQANYYVEGQTDDPNDMTWIRAGTQLVIGVKPTNYNDTERRAVYAAAGLAYPGTSNTPAGFGSWYCSPGVQSGTFTVDAGTDVFTVAGTFSPYIVTGTKLRVSNSGGSLPSDISAGTDYYAIVSGGTIKLASSFANAQAGTAIDITDAGSGTHTASLSGAAFVVRQASRKGGGTTWTDRARAIAGPNGEDPWGGGCAGTVESPATLTSDLSAPGCWDTYNLTAGDGIGHFWYAGRKADGSIERACPRTTNGDPYALVPAIEVKNIYEVLGPEDYIDNDWHFDSDRMRMATTECPDPAAPCDGESGGNTPDTVNGVFYSRVSIDECRQVSLDFCPGATLHADYSYGWYRPFFDLMQRECLGIPVRGIEPSYGPAECNASQMDPTHALKYGTIPSELRVWTDGCANLLNCQDASPDKPLERYQVAPDEMSGETHIDHDGVAFFDLRDMVRETEDFVDAGVELAMAG
jgi:hypothetical protein